MAAYLDRFNRIIRDQEQARPNREDMWRTFAAASPLKSIHETALTAAIRDFVGIYATPAACISQCVGCTFTLSNLLLANNVPHVFTLGDVEVDGEPVFHTTQEWLRRDLERGFTGDTAEYHCWITLMNGTVIDMCIWPQLARDVLALPYARWRDIRTRSAGDGFPASAGLPEHDIRHKPLMAGVEHYLSTSISPERKRIVAPMLHAWVEGVSRLLGHS